MTKTIIAAAAVIAMMTGKVTLTQTDITKCGGWTEKENTAITPEMQEIFDEAMDRIIGVDYVPVEMIGTQLVSGTNYKFRCESQAAYPGAKKKEVIMTVNVSLYGNITIVSIE